MKRLVLLILAAFPVFSMAQRTYKPNSVLASGNWYKIAVKNAGIYKIDIPFLAGLGISTANLASNSIRLFGNGGGMLAEANSVIRSDDLEENAIMVVDGGDGVLNGEDYILFFSNGADQWLKDSINKKFFHRKNLYSDFAYYYLSIGGNGKRISPLVNSFIPNISITSFNDRLFHELDTINFLSSGKEWYSEEFANIPGHSLTRNFSVNISNLQTGSAITVVNDCLARSVSVGSRFDISVNGQPLQQINIPAVSGGQYDLVAQEIQAIGNANVSQPNLLISYNYVPGSFNSQGWLNWFEIFSRRNLSMNGIDQLLFRDWNSVGNNIGEFIITTANSNTQVWDVTDPLTPVNIQANLQGSDLKFVNSCSQLKEYVAFNPSNFLQPLSIGKISNQNLHGLTSADFIIVTPPSLLPQAQRLGQFHLTKNNLRYTVATTDQVFNEFSSGIPDPVAIRDFVKMFYDRSVTNPSQQPKYLLLFGDASFDYKDRIKNNTNLVPAYESNNSLAPLNTYTSDDFFGFLDDNEDINSMILINQLDIGIGRMPARNIEEAKNYIDKVEAYYGKESFGPWRNNQLFIADDEDFNLHLQDAEVLTATSQAVAPVFNITKTYLDAFKQESGAGGSRYPQANQMINNQLYNGTLIWNYSGHGGASRLAEEVILDQDVVNNWSNANKLPLFITATCDFAPYDNPTVNSLGENILLRPKTGGIALMTTTRVVFSFSNRIINNNYLQFALQTDTNGVNKSLGESIRIAKNYTYQTSGDMVNNRKFTLLGDPALTLAYPTLKIRATKINNTPVAQVDTISATEKVIIEGEVTDIQGNVLSNFNGTAYPVVFDKVQTINTLANDATSQVTGFQTQNNILYKGKASVTNGKFSFSFKMPKDINYQFGNGKLSLYADNGSSDANGYFTNFIVGGTSNNLDNDNQGPVIKAYLNDEKFVNGSVTNEKPILIVKLSDSSGINTAGTGIGHDLVATLDNDNRQYFILNDFYEADLNSYQQGVVHFQLPALTAGMHSLKIKAWDVLNNSSEYILEFNVAKDEELVLSHVLNYPNPFTTKTQFWFEHNRSGQNLQVKVQIFTVTGKVVKTIKQTINNAGNRSCEIEWDGRDEYGDKLGRGVYLYRLTVNTPDGKKKERIERLVIL
ncbi:MAG TPA: type IX secretion system sortase PorU [Chitinophagaceae bacterium]|nr:type IX secretion system sortase PorU [Chitinophagaceae bacterium]